MFRHRSAGARRVAVAALCFALLLVVAPSPASAARDRTPPSPAPSSLRITATTPTSVSLAWNRSTDASTFWYCVQWNGGGCLRVDPPRTTLTVSRLLPNRTHTFSVYAVDIVGNRSANSNTVSFTTPRDTAPPSPAPTISVTRLLPTRAVLAWPQPVDDTSSQVFWTLFVNGEVSGYADRLGPPTQTFLTLTPETTYTFQVSVRDRDGNSVTGPPRTVTTPPKTEENAPTVPTGLQGGSSDGLDLELRWNASTDDTDAPADIRYDVYLDGVRAAAGLGARTILSCSSDDPVAIVVRAVDTSGNESGPSATLLFDECNP
jgi:chitodextrinase